MKKILALLLIVAFALTAYAGDHFNHKVYEYIEVDTDNDGWNAFTNVTTGDFLNDPSTWGISGYSVTNDATQLTSSIEPGEISQYNNVQGGGDNIAGMLMRQTNYIGNNYECYTKFYRLDEGGDYFVLGVKVYDDVISYAYDPYPTVDAQRSDYVEIRFDPANDAPHKGIGNSGIKWEVGSGSGYSGYSYPNGYFWGGVVFDGAINIWGALSDNTVTVGGNTRNYWMNADAANDDISNYANYGDYVAKTVGFHSEGFYVNFWWDMDHAASGDGVNASNGRDIESLGLAIVVKDHDGENTCDADHDRTWNGGLHNSDGSCKWAYGADGTDQGKKSDVICNSPQYWATYEKAGRKVEFDLVNCSFDGTDLILDWDAPIGFDGTLTYKVYACPDWDDSFNKYPAYFDNSATDLTWDTVENRYEMSGVAHTPLFNIARTDEFDNTPGTAWVDITLDDDDVVANTFTCDSFGAVTLANVDRYFFLVTVLDGGIEYEIPSEMFGFQKYACQVNDPGTDINFVGNPFNKGINTASELGTYMGTSNVNTISKWDEDNQGWVSAGYIPDVGWVNDFEIGSHGCYMIGAVQNFSFYSLGILDRLPMWNLVTTSATNINNVYVPLNAPDDVVATDAVETIVTDTAKIFDGAQTTRINTVSKWDVGDQAWTTRTVGVGGDTFTLTKGMPLQFGVVQGMDLRWPVYDNYENHDAQLPTQLPHYE